MNFKKDARRMLKELKNHKYGWETYIQDKPDYIKKAFREWTHTPTPEGLTVQQRDKLYADQLAECLERALF
jgi:hypothetical protein